MSRTPQELVAKLERSATAVQRAQRQGVEAAAFAATTVVRASMAAKGVPSGTVLRGVGRRGARVSARYDVKGAENATALVSMRGPAHLVENPTKPHVIAARRRPGVRTRRRGARALALPDGFATQVQHPGTSGKRFWRDAMPEARRVAPEAYRLKQTTALRREFTG